MTIKDFLDRLEDVIDKTGGYLARCPVCGRLSLLVAEGDDRILVRCDADCLKEDILTAIGLTKKDLFFGSTGNNTQPRTVATPTGERTGARLQTLENLSEKFSGEITYLWRQHIPVGMPVIVNGREGIGKTLTCLEMACEILSAHEGYVVWLATEAFIVDTIAKAHNLGLGDNEKFLVAEKDDGDFRFDFRHRGDFKKFEQVLHQIPGRLLCVFIDSIRGMTNSDDNDPKIGGIMHRLNSLICDKHKATLVYLKLQIFLIKP